MRKELKIVEKNAEPTPIEKSDLFSSFAEVEIEVKEIKQLINIMFNYMPAHVDILKPSDILLKNFDLNVMCNKNLLKMHQYDEIASKMVYERNILAKRLQDVAKMLNPKVAEAPKERKIK